MGQKAGRTVKKTCQLVIEAFRASKKKKKTHNKIMILSSESLANFNFNANTFWLQKIFSVQFSVKTVQTGVVGAGVRAGGAALGQSAASPAAVGHLWTCSLACGRTHSLCRLLLGKTSVLAVSDSVVGLAGPWEGCGHRVGCPRGSCHPPGAADLPRQFL